MRITKQIAEHLRQVYFGGNWTYSDMKNVLADISCEQASKKIDSFNTIAVLVFHTNYFVCVAIMVLRGEPLTAHDKYSFDLPPNLTDEGWQKLKAKSFTDAETLALLIEQLPENKLWDDFADKKYGNYYRNLHGIIEHTHYHLGQIAILKKLTVGQ